MKNPMIHLIIGEGRGKTTSAYGLAIRALGQGLTVAVINFLKSDLSGELKALRETPAFGHKLTVYCFEKHRKFYHQLNEPEREMLRREICESFICFSDLISRGTCDLVILDEVIDAVNLSLISLPQLISVLQRNTQTEIVMTGRDPHPKLYELADYVSEIKKIKHPYDQGILARKGIEY